jgi:hypothetical protein
MNKETNNLTGITGQDIVLVERELAQTPKPVSIHALAEKLAFQKTAGQRTQDVKKYNEFCRYEVGDYVYKEYDENLTVGSKSVEHFKGAVILRVLSKAFFRAFNCEMLEVDYTGGGPFRKYIDYMKKTKTQVLLPSNMEAKGLVPDIIQKGEDPRLTELPMTDRDLKTLEKHLRTELAKSPNLFSWNDSWQLAAKRIEIPEEKVKEIESEFDRTGLSWTTEDLVKRFFGIEPSHDLFDIHCLSLNALLEKKFKKEFILLSDAGWGKWHLKRILNALPENLPLAAPMALLPPLEEIEKPEMSIVQDFPIKVYLTWREILSGGIKIPRSLNKALSHAREYIFTDPEEGKAYTVYYYPASNYFLGLKDYYAVNNIPQGTSLTLERKGPTHFHFWIKKSKKKLSVVKLNYDFPEDKFSDAGEDVFTFSMPNKIIYIERETLAKLLPLHEQRGDLDLRELLIMIFKDAALASTSHSLHFLRAYHLLDVLKQTTQEDVEFTLLNSPEFIKSDKKKGIFQYQEPYVFKEEIPSEMPLEEIPAEIPAEVPSEEMPAEEVSGLELEPEEEPAEARGEEAARRLEAEEKAKAAPPPKKEKPAKKKKAKIDGEKGARPKKSERRVIEERIEEEESELEALSAIKEKEEEAVEIRAKERREKKEEVKAVPKEEPKFGLFGDLLKTALKKTADKKEEKKEEKAEESR